MDEIAESFAIDAVAPTDDESYTSLLSGMSCKVGVEHTGIESAASLVTEDRIGWTPHEVLAYTLSLLADHDDAVLGFFGAEGHESDRLAHALYIGIDRRCEVSETVGGDDDLNVHIWYDLSKKVGNYFLTGITPIAASFAFSRSSTLH